MRDLPWRHTRDPWAILVSEVMLQQTQAARVMPAWQVFMTRWPTPAACAADPVGEVIRAWGGLGYNRRAVNLHRCAGLCANGLPSTLEGLLALPGVGPYTARAVLAFAYEQDVAVVDVNVARVLTRRFGAAAPRALQSAADALVPPGHGWEWNQYMIDVGATICTARDPACERCPFATDCGRHRWSTTKQSRFEGSRRQARAQLLDRLRAGPVVEADRQIADSLVRDGLARWRGDELTLD